MNHAIVAQSFRGLNVLLARSLAEKEVAVIFGKQLSDTVDFGVTERQRLAVESTCATRGAQRGRDRGLVVLLIKRVAERDEAFRRSLTRLVLQLVQDARRRRIADGKPTNQI